MSRRAWWIYLLVLLPGLPIYVFVVHGTLQRCLYSAYGCSAVAAILVGVVRNRPPKRAPWLLFAAGLVLFCAGDIALDIYSASGRPIPVPSGADFLYFSVYPVLAIGLMLLVRDRVRGGDLTSALDGAMVALGVGVVAWVFVMAPYAHDRTLTIGQQVVPILYPAFDLLLLAVAVRLLLSRGPRNTSFWLLASSVTALLVFDGFYAVATLHNSYTNGDSLDIGWLIMYGLWGAAALHPSMSQVTEPSPVDTSPHRPAVLGLLGATALVPPATLIIQSALGEHPDTVVLATTSAVMFLLVVGRLSLLSRALNSSNHELQQSAARQTVLRDAAAAFVSAGDVESVITAGVHAAAALGGDDRSWSSFVTIGPDGPTVAAVTGPAPYGAGQQASVALQHNWQTVIDEGAMVLGAVDESSPEGPRSFPERYVTPVFVGETLRGVLAVGAVTVCPTAVLPALAVVCAEMGLAMGGAEGSEERLRARADRKFRSLVQNSSDVVTLIDAKGTVIYQSPSIEAVFGRDPASVVGLSMTDVIHPDDLEGAWAELASVLDTRAATATFECRIAHADGTWREVHTVLTNLLEDPEVGAIVLNSRDVAQRRALERELNRQAFHDSLTGLANRALFVDRVSHALDRADREAGPIAVLFLDIDDFKTVNDSLGHPAGDELLVAVAARLKESLRPGDTAARFGGDEFALLLESGEMPQAAQTVAHRVAQLFAAPLRIGTTDVSVRVSIGIALGQPPVDTADGLLRDADLAMYMAKRNGKGRFEMFRPAMHQEAVRRLETAADLRHALEEGQLEVFYQAIVNVASKVAIGAEALVRWHHPTRGLVGPVEFIPIAESTGLIVPLGKWVLGEACRQAQAWRGAGIVDDGFYISVNLSARQLQDPALLDDVKGALAGSGLPATALLLEVTESGIMEDLDTAVGRLLELKELGLRLAVDDFGTGYSSLSYLRNLPIDVVKIDKSFIDRVTLDPEGVAVVRGVIDLSAALGLKVVAEGVEAREQLVALDTLGCDSVQGFLFSKPMGSREFVETLSRLQFTPA